MRIAITGIGIISALGAGQQINRQQLLAGHSGVGGVRYLPTRHHAYPIGEVPFSNSELAVMAGYEADTTISRNTLIAAVALRETIADASIHNSKFIIHHLINGTTVGGMDKTETYFTEWKKGNYATLHYIRDHRAAVHSQQLAEHFGIEHVTTVSTACSSALNSIITAVQMLRTGEAQQVIAGGVDAMTRVHLNGFASLGILSQQLCRPFQPDRDGINLGEGAAYLVLETEQSALQRGAHIYGYIAGYANVCDAYHPTASSPDGEGAFNAMSQALEMAQLQPNQINYINAHGTATPNNDASEWTAIERLFGKTLPVVESTKPLTGHTTSASGSIEVIFCLMKMAQKGYHYAINNAFGFGGNDSSIVLSTHPTDISHANGASIHHSINSHECGASLAASAAHHSISPMQARRMTPMMRQLIACAESSIRHNSAVQLAEGVQLGDLSPFYDSPDAIVVGTQWGAMVPSLELLDTMLMTDEQEMKPSLFMMAANNAIAGTLARHLNCKGYNITLMGCEDMYEQAIEHAKRIIRAGDAKRVLVCGFDEQAPIWQDLLTEAGCPADNIAKAQMICIN
ncbi:MAG: beta-ketoacyl-[acyl-carrier-protein] synthase family protein [Bacteroidales bacterium]|nr:beta-ketoacyl-[acyl-carrier-protein] synthase family protein [Bacteroidales bacterium]